MRKLLLIILLGICAGQGFAQLNVALLHQLIADSKAEHERQIQARGNQAISSVNESVNNSSLSKLKSSYRQIQSRFSVLGGAVDALQIGVESAPILSEIVQSQSAIITYCSHDPLLIPLAAAAQIDLADRSGLLLRYIYGLSLSLGELNQMRQSDRKLLFSFVISELRAINGASRGLQASLEAVIRSRKRSGGLFPSFLDRDRVLIDNILKNSRQLKN